MRKGRMMLREMTITVLGVITLLMIVIIPQTASAVSLKQTSIINDTTIKLGDIFAGLETNADKVLGPAPQPGSDMVLNAHTLMRIAVALDLPWRPSSSAEQITLKRAATVIDHTMIDETLKTALAEKGIPGKFNLLYGNAQQIILPIDQKQTVEIASLKLSPDLNHFEATLAAPSAKTPLQTIDITGKIEQLIEVPVLNAAMQNGDIIDENDLEFINMRSDQLNHDTVVNADDLLGMTPRRLLTPGKVIKAGEVQPPQIVGRGELVTMVFTSGSLTLTAQGKALENGAKGDVIRVVNASSNRTIQAKVSNYKEVTVEAF